MIDEQSKFSCSRQSNEMSRGVAAGQGFRGRVAGVAGTQALMRFVLRLLPSIGLGLILTLYLGIFDLPEVP